MDGDDLSVSDTWLVGVVANGDALAGMRVHGGWLAAGPASGRPQRVHVRLRFGDDGVAGFPDPTESAKLLHAEEAVVEAFADDAVFVSVVTARGFRDLIFHTADATRCGAALDALDPDAVGYPLDLDVDDDPGWSHYRASFTDVIPADADRRLIADLTREHPDGPPTCTVVHRFGFPSLLEADQAAAALRTSGVTVTYCAPDDVDASPPPVLEAREVETVTQAEMARSRDALTAFALSWGGSYHGWTAEEK